LSRCTRIAEHRGGDLGVEQGARDRAEHMVKQLQILARGVQDLDHVGVFEQLHQRREILHRQGIDAGLTAVGGDLDQCQ